MAKNVKRARIFFFLGFFFILLFFAILWWSSYIPYWYESTREARWGQTWFYFPYFVTWIILMVFSVIGAIASFVESTCS